VGSAKQSGKKSERSPGKWGKHCDREVRGHSPTIHPALGTGGKTASALVSSMAMHGVDEVCEVRRLDRDLAEATKTRE
jgi:hypothetical protein